MKLTQKWKENFCQNFHANLYEAKLSWMRISTRVILPEGTHLPLHFVHNRMSSAYKKRIPPTVGSRQGTKDCPPLLVLPSRSEQWSRVNNNPFGHIITAWSTDEIKFAQSGIGSNVTLLLILQSGNIQEI